MDDFYVFSCLRGKQIKGYGLKLEEQKQNIILLQENAVKKVLVTYTKLLLTDDNFAEIVETADITFSTVSSAVMPECATRTVLEW